RREKSSGAGDFRRGAGHRLEVPRRMETAVLRIGRGGSVPPGLHLVRHKRHADNRHRGRRWLDQPSTGWIHRQGRSEGRRLALVRTLISHTVRFSVIRAAKGSAMSNRMWVFPVGLVLGGLLSAHPVVAQEASNVELRREIMALGDTVKAMQKDLQDIKALLQRAGAPPPPPEN